MSSPNLKLDTSNDIRAKHAATTEPLSAFAKLVRLSLVVLGLPVRAFKTEKEVALQLRHEPIRVRRACSDSMRLGSNGKLQKHRATDERNASSSRLNLS